MERKKINELWQRQDVRNAEAILNFYLDQYSKVVFVGSGEKYDSVPNHQAVTDMNADAKTLRIGTACEYCHYCKNGIKVLKALHYKTEAKYLYYQFIFGRPISKKNMLRLLNYSPTSSSVLSGLLPLALKDFAQHCPKKYFKELLIYEETNNKYDKHTDNHTLSTSDSTVKTK